MIPELLSYLLKLSLSLTGVFLFYLLPPGIVVAGR